jgi:hypothetical protein
MTNRARRITVPSVRRRRDHGADDGRFCDARVARGALRARIGGRFQVRDGDGDGRIRGKLSGVAEIEHAIRVEHDLASIAVDREAGLDGDLTGAAPDHLQALGDPERVEQPVDAPPHVDVIALLVGEVRFDQRHLIEVVNAFDRHLAAFF